MKSCALALSHIGLLILVGCDSVTIQQPLGEIAPNASKALEGTWIGEDGQIIEARVSKLGELFVGGLDWDEAKDQFKAETANVRATQAGKLQFLQIKSDPKSPDERFTFGRYEIGDGKALKFYSPVVSVFEHAVESGKLKGSIQRRRHETEVRIDEPAKVVLDFIEKSGADKCFEKQPSMTFRLLQRRQ